MMKVLRFTSLFFFFHFSAPVAFGVDSRDPSSLSSDKEEDSVSSPRVDFVTQGNGVNGSVVDPQDDGHKSSVQRRLKKAKAPKSVKKNKSSPVSSPTDSPVSSPTDSPVSSPTSSPIDLACVEVFTGNRTYIPSCANYINEIIVSCDSEGQCEYFHQSIELDDDGKPVLDEDRCTLKGEFSYAKVKVKSSQCDLDLEPIPLSPFGKCSFSDQGFDYGAPNMLKSEIRPDGTMNLIFSTDNGETFFEDIRVATPRTEEATRRLEPNTFRTTVCEANKFVVASFAMGGEIVSGHCTTSAECQSVNPDSWCSTRNGVGFPDPYLCYECLNDNHCPGAEVCVTSNANRVCESPSIRSVPGINNIRTGYNLFKADPLITQFVPSSNSERALDPGAQNYRVFDLEWSDAGNYEVFLGDEDGEPHFEPIGFEVSPKFVGVEATVHKTFENSDSFSKEQGSALGISGSGTIKGVDVGASAGVASRESMSKDARTKTITVNAKSIRVLYEFRMQSGTRLPLNDRVKTDLREIGNSLDWDAFFERYGTHLTVGGQVGAWKRQTFRFTESEKKSLSETSDSFETTMSVGIPGIFSLDTTTHNDETKKAAKSILSNSATTVTITNGDINDTDKSVLISRNLIPICDQIDQVVDKDECYDELLAYCVREIRKIVPGAEECVLGNEFSFQCFQDDDCDGKRKCAGAFCVPECRTDSECKGLFEECSSGECKPIRGETDGCKTVSGRHHWTGCVGNPKCPAGYTKHREENTACWFSYKRWVCERKGYITPPCTKPLKGTCGGGKRGNGCCANGGGCSQWGWCGNGAAWTSEVNPTHQQCKDMGARY